MLKKLKEQINRLIKPSCDWLIDEEGHKIDVYSSCYWSEDNEAAYQKSEELIRNYKIDNDLVEIFAWCDISGYHYHVIEREEDNYVSIDVVLKKEEYTDEEITTISQLIDIADEYFVNKLTN